MGQINTNNYPAVDSLLDADLLIVENATHGTGTTTPKQLRENAIGTDPLQTTAQTVTGAINEILEMAADTVVGLELGKMTSFSDGVIVTDIDLHRAPVAGDRILFYHNAAVASPSSLTTYNDGVAVTTTIGDFSLTHPAGLTLMKCVALGESLRWQTVQDIADGGYTAGTGISINGTTINNSAPQLGDDIAYSRIDTVTSGALGYFSADADCLVMDFRTDAEPYNGGYTLRLTTTGASFKYAVLKDKTGNNYAEEIPSGSLVLCKSNVSGTGSEADPVVVTVLEIGNTEMAHDVEVLKDICITEKTVSGNPITVTDALPYPAVSVSAEIEAEQDLHGYDKPWVGGSGKNKAHIDSTKIFSTNKNPSDAITGIADGMLILSSSANGYIRGENVVSYTINGSNSVTAKMADNDASASYGVGVVVEIDTSKTYTLSLVKTGGSVRIGWLNSDGSNLSFNGEQTLPCNLTPPSGAKYLMILCCPGRNAEHTFSNIQLEVGSSATTFNPWSNICPISGRTSVTITDVDAESQTATVTVQLGQTVYGGTLNVTTGVLTIDHMAHIFDGTEDITVLDNRFVYNKTGESPQGNNDYNCISSHYKSETNLIVYQNRNTAGFVGMCAHGSAVIWNDNIHFMSNDVTAYKAYLVAQQTAGTPLTAVWKLVTPQTIQLTPTDLQMLKGYNRLSCDGGGDITLTYRADRLAAIEAALAAL